MELLLITANFSLSKLLISTLSDEAINQTRTGESERERGRERGKSGGGVGCGEKKIK